MDLTKPHRLCSFATRNVAQLRPRFHVANARNVFVFHGIFGVNAAC
jgi:hypothetical protein